MGADGNDTFRIEWNGNEMKKKTLNFWRENSKRSEEEKRRYCKG
jgi:hypothetical protein